MNHSLQQRGTALVYTLQAQVRQASFEANSDVQSVEYVKPITTLAVSHNTVQPRYLRDYWSILIPNYEFICFNYKNNNKKLK